jgi:hypothetical protein
MKKVAILGAGPAGLIAAHTFAMEGWAVAIYSAPDANGHAFKSKIGGAQFLHSQIPGIPMKLYARRVTYQTRGTADGYRGKVYANTHPAAVPFVSFDNIHDGMEQVAYPMIGVYDWLWNQFEYNINRGLTDIDGTVVDQLINMDFFDEVVTSIPAPAICRVPNLHTFVSKEIKVWNECVMEGLPDNTILYNGDPNGPSWYRCSKLFGHGSTEWSSELNPPLSPLMTLRKPLFTNCDCYAGSVHRVGRQGKWTKGVLAHEAYVDALSIIERTK